MKNLFIILLTFLSISSLNANTFPRYEGVVAVEGVDAEGIYKLIKGSYSSLRLSDLSEITSNGEQKTITIKGIDTFDFSLIAMRFYAKVILNIDFMVRDGRFKYVITVTDVQADNINGRSESAYDDLLNHPKRPISKKLFPKVNNTIDNLIMKIESIGKAPQAENTQDNW